MDDELKKMLDELTSKEPEALNDNDIKFLRARSSYLTKVQKEKFADVLNVDAEEQKEEEKPKSKPRDKKEKEVKETPIEKEEPKEAEEQKEETQENESSNEQSSDEEV